MGKKFNIHKNNDKLVPAYGTDKNKFDSTLCWQGCR